MRASRRTTRQLATARRTRARLEQQRARVVDSEDDTTASHNDEETLDSVLSSPAAARVWNSPPECAEELWDGAMPVASQISGEELTRRRLLLLPRPEEPAANAPEEPAASKLSEPAASAPKEPAASAPEEPAVSQLSEREESAPEKPAASALEESTPSHLTEGRP